MTSYLKLMIAQKIRDDWSPEQTSALRNVRTAGMDPVLEKINNRPRKTLGYATPKEVFFGLINGNNLGYQNVALII